MTSDVTFTFPVPFPTACVGIQTLNDNGASNQTPLSGFSKSKVILTQSNSFEHNVYILAYGY